MRTKQKRSLRGIYVPAFVLCGILCLAILGPLLTPYGYDEIVAEQFQKPGLDHWFGTDIHGRDLFTRVLLGARISLSVGLAGALISFLIGVTYGLLSGWIGGAVDSAMMRFVDLLYSLPRIVLVIVVIAVFDGKAKLWMDSTSLAQFVPYTRLLLMFLALGMIEWLTMARIIRGQVLRIKALAFVQAAQSMGQNTFGIVFQHLLPNLRGIILVYVTLTIPTVILEESFLSFLGLGIQAPQSSWGTLLSDGAFIINPVKSYWWILAGPAFFMALTLMSLNFLGDALRDYYDPKST
ncbi:MAG: ABC transporter permease [Verrucomicrobiota bacterium]